MLSNMFTIAWRNALRHKQFTLLNILGLSLGLTATFLIGLYIQDESRYDRFFEDSDQIYRVNMPMIWGDWEEEFASTGPNVALALREDIPEFELVTRIHNPNADFLSYEQPNGTKLHFEEANFFVADSNFFQVFSFEFVLGDPEKAFNSPGQVILTQETAKRYFGDDDPLGKTIQIEKGESKGPLVVSGIIKDIPTHSHIQFDLLATMYTIPYIENRQWSWIWTTFGTYAKVNSGVNLDALEEKMQKIPSKWGEVTANRVFDQTWADYIGEKDWFLKLQALEKAYIYSPPSGNRFGPEGNAQHIKIFTAVGILILILSCMNFMNLSTARSTKRAKEVGIRKVLGSQRKNLIQQFILESILFVFISTILALILTEFSLGSFNAISGKELSLYQELTEPMTPIGLLIMIVMLGSIAGTYPAFYLSSFKPISVLNGKNLQGFSAKGIRNFLVFFQFAMSIALILCTVFVQKQLDYTANYGLGFDKENVLQIQNSELLGSEANSFKNYILAMSEVEAAGFSGLTPPNIYNEDKYLADEPDAEIVTLKSNWVDSDYLELLGLELIWGRNLEKGRPEDQNSAIINESALKQLGWSMEDFNSGTKSRHITFPWNKEIKFKVIGIVKNFNYNSLRQQIDPLMIISEENDMAWSDGSKILSIRLKPSSLKDRAHILSLIDRVESKFDELSNGQTFKYSFLDQDFDVTFSREQKMGTILNIFTVMAISIACLGLFGVASFTAEQRKKELGVRKVLGASVARIIYNFGSEFGILIILAVIVASPIAYYFVNNWLSDFAYKTPISWWVFISTGFVAFAIGWVTIAYQSLRAANRNPVEVLRDE